MLPYCIAFSTAVCTEHKILGGNWGWHVIVPLVHQDVALGAGSKSKFGLGDVTVNPFIVSWHAKNWHWAIGLDRTCRWALTRAVSRVRALCQLLERRAPVCVQLHG